MSAKWKGAVLLVAMYGVGVFTGIAWYTFRMHRPAAVRAVYASRRLKKLETELHLTTVQQVALKDILDKAHDRAQEINEEVSWDLADIHRDSIQAIRQVLTPDQARTFDQIHKKYHLKNRHIPDDDLNGMDTPGNPHAAIVSPPASS